MTKNVKYYNSNFWRSSIISRNLNVLYYSRIVMQLRQVEYYRSFYSTFFRITAYRFPEWERCLTQSGNKMFENDTHITYENSLALSSVSNKCFEVFTERESSLRTIYRGVTLISCILSRRMSPARRKWILQSMTSSATLKRSALEENPFHLKDARVENHVHVYI